MNEDDYITVPKLSEWQHYKKRTPPWIKLHRDVLNDYKFSRLQDASKAHLIAIWLLASQMDNKIPADSKWIAQKINATQDVDIVGLCVSGFLKRVAGASNALAGCNQNASVEAEREAETESLPKKEVNTVLKDGSYISLSTGEEITPFDEGVSL